jgi:spore coat polysaccharide biosynthesis protein SpsF (cytidylyltransferase family)
MIDVAVCIQIRDGNSRLPGKGSKMLRGKPIYEHMIENVDRCINFINNHKIKKNVQAQLILLVPFDEYKDWCLRVSNLGKKIKVFSGEEGQNSDVLERFKKVFKILKPNYIVRLTGDCPFIPSALINKIITCASNHKLDYISNVDEELRTMPDGFDVECISDECFLWLSERNVSESDKEHVTTHIRSNVQPWMRIATISSIFDTSDYKYSIDTKEDFAEIEKRIRLKQKKDKLAKSKGYGIYEF